MNERIKELAKEARNYARDYVADCKHYGHYMEHNELEVKFEEKFAELIVRECMELTKQCSTGKGIHDLFADEIIAEHFGVEE